jgi:glycosyltransferase involved in cell wall biosynthesis
MAKSLKGNLSLGPLVSILIPAYNAERWIADAINCALAQTWRRKEIIVVDDGSTDRTCDIATQFSDRCVKVISQLNAGAAVARNRALSLSQGDFIQWLDADDILDPDKIAQQIAVTSEFGARTLLSSDWGRFYYRHSKARFTSSALWGDLSPAEWLTRKLEGNLYMIIESWLVSRELTVAAGPWDESLSADDDGEYFCRVLCASDGVKHVSKARSYYRISGNGSVSSATLSETKLQSQFRSIRLHIRYLLSLENSARTRAACFAYLQRWLIHFYPEQTEICMQAAEIAETLGGHLESPLLPQKYDLIRGCFGWGPAKRAMLTLPKVRTNLCQRWDGILFTLGR